MANTLTGLTPAIYEAYNTVSREMVGMIPAVRSNFDASRAAVGQSIVFPVVAARTAIATTPAAYGPSSVDTSAPGTTITISKSYGVPIYLTGEEGLGMGKSQGLYWQQAFAQAIRTLVNTIEADLALAGVNAASRAYGAAGTAPFGTAADFSDAAGVMRILDDNGAPDGDRHLVLNSAAMFNIRAKQANLFNSGNQIFERGTLAELEGLFVGKSAQLASHVKGTGTSYVTSGVTAPGVASIALVTGSGTVLAGDVVTFAADAVNKYMVNTGVAAPGTISIGQPGAQVSIATANAMTIGATYSPNLAFDRNAIWLATRAPAEPSGGDAAVDSMMVSDAVSGLTFEVREYRQYHQVAYEVAIAWGVAAVNSQHIAILLG